MLPINCYYGISVLVKIETVLISIYGIFGISPNASHKITNLKPLQKGDKVWLTDRKAKGIVLEKSATRSYIVQTDDQGTYRRNHEMIIPMPSDNRKVLRSNEQVTPKDTIAKQSHRPVVAIPIQQRQAPLKANNT